MTMTATDAAALVRDYRANRDQAAALRREIAQQQEALERLDDEANDLATRYGTYQGASIMQGLIDYPERP